jgi:hypothetical protein
MSAPHVFTEQFRQHVIPRLDAPIPGLARSVALDRESYTHAYYTLWRFAWRRGTQFLTEKLQHELDDWLHQRLCDEVYRQDALVLAADEAEESAADFGPCPPDDIDDVFAAYEALRKGRNPNAR